jgi:hypothetical protein
MHGAGGRCAAGPVRPAGQPCRRRPALLGNVTSPAGSRGSFPGGAGATAPTGRWQDGERDGDAVDGTGTQPA